MGEERRSGEGGGGPERAREALHICYKYLFLCLGEGRERGRGGAGEFFYEGGPVRAWRGKSL